MKRHNGAKQNSGFSCQYSGLVLDLGLVLGLVLDLGLVLGLVLGLFLGLVFYVHFIP